MTNSTKSYLKKRKQNHSTRKKHFNKYDSIRLPITKSKIVSDVIKEYISILIENSIQLKIHEKIKGNSTSIRHYCYVCQKQISVDVSSLIFGNGKLLSTHNFMCSEHKKSKVNIKRSFVWFRFETAFYNKLKTLIKLKNEIFENWN